MSKLLYIEASPRGERSKSSKVAKAFVDAYKKTHPEDSVEHINLWKISLPSFDGDMLEAKYAVLGGQSHSPEQAAAWKTVSDMAEVFKSADKYLISVPMWNFGLPYKLKHYFDIITQPGLTFSFTPQEGYKGLVTGKAVVIYARGGAYGEGSGAEAYDLQSKSLAMHLGFIGITDQANILVEPTLAAPDAVDQSVAKAENQAAAIAASF
jgi:FMN-dependent NADH-azoreductase